MEQREGLKRAIEGPHRSNFQVRCGPQAIYCPGLKYRMAPCKIELVAHPKCGPCIQSSLLQKVLNGTLCDLPGCTLNVNHVSRCPRDRASDGALCKFTGCMTKRSCLQMSLLERVLDEVLSRLNGCNPERSAMSPDGCTPQRSAISPDPSLRESIGWSPV